MATKVDIEATRTAAPNGTNEAAPHATASNILASRDRERYEIVGEHGRGGLGRVFRAHDRELGRDVAVKELLLRGHGSELRFFREALITARLEHPGIVPVHEAGRWSDGTPFYAMKLVGGRSLKQLIDDRPMLTDRLPLIGNLVAVADAMAYAHDHRIIHRDLKPANVMVGDFGETIIIDWGLAKVDDESTDDEDEVPYRSAARNELTAAGASLGTPAYMAPEQFGGKVDHRTDIYALGGLLYHVLSGHPPHEERDARSSKPPALSRTIPEDLAAIVARAMEHDQGKRYPTARALAEDLQRYQRHARVTARRYSLLARLGLAFERHRAVATVAMLALLVLSATFGIAALKISRGRSVAIVERERAQVSNAMALLERDPTRAWQALQGVPATVDTMLLRARIRTAGVADRIVPLPARFEQIQVTSDGTRVIVSTADRALSVFNPTTGSFTHLADGLTEPSLWSSNDERVYFVRRLPHLALATVPLAGNPVTEMASLDHMPVKLDVDAHRVWWTIDGDLFVAAADVVPTPIAHEVEDFAISQDDAAWCHDGVLVRSHDRTTVGTCSRHDFAFSASSGFGYMSAGHLEVFQHGQKRIVDTSAATDAQFDAVSDTGLIVGRSGTTDGVYLRPGASTVEHVPFASPVMASAVRDDVAAWGLADGSVEVRDTLHHVEWRIQAHSEAVWCVLLMAHGKLVTCVRQELRVWSLPNDGVTTIAKIAAPANNFVFNSNHEALLDGNNGTAYVIAPGAFEATPFHQHDHVAFGAAWCDGEACTSGWDGRVTCSDVVRGTSRVAAQLDSVTAWLAEGAGHCFTITTNGGVYDVRTPARPLYSHVQEPYRVAVSGDGSHIASVDWGGGVKVYDVARHVVVAEAILHHGQVTDVSWANDELVTVGADGRLIVSSVALEEHRTWQLGGAIRYLAVVGNHAGIGLDDGSLIFLSTRNGVLHRFATRETFSSLALAPDGSTIAAGTSTGEVLVVTADGRAAAARLERGRITCLAFDQTNAISLCAPSQRIVRIPLTALSFESAEKKTVQGDK